jgi:peroxiredoxin
MAMVPHERSLVSKLQDRPFALLGVNVDSSKEELKEAQERQKITWRSFWDDHKRIARKFKVDRYPMLFLIDHNGVIRKIHIGRPDDAELERDIIQLVKEAESSPTA